MSSGSLSYIAKKFKKAKSEAKMLIENNKVDIIELDKRIMSIRDKVAKTGRSVPSEITMNDRYVHLANELSR